MDVTVKELRELAAFHTEVADKAERIGPNIGYARTFRVCAAAMTFMADSIEGNINVERAFQKDAERQLRAYGQLEK